MKPRQPFEYEPANKGIDLMLQYLEVLANTGTLPDWAGEMHSGYDVIDESYQWGARLMVDSWEA